MSSVSDLDYSLQYLRHSDPGHGAAIAMAQRTLDTLRPHLPKNKQAKIIEIGPGNGIVLGLLKEEGHLNVEGWEVDKSLAQKAVQNGFPVKFVDAESINQQLSDLEDTVDFIFFMHVLEHIDVDKQIDFLKSVKKALRPGEKMLCEVPNAHSPIASHYRYNDWTHRILFTIESLEFVISLAGFKNIGSSPALPSIVVPRSKYKDIIMKTLKVILLSVSHSFHRLHLLAELGVAGLKYPIGFAIIAVGCKSSE